MLSSAVKRAAAQITSVKPMKTRADKERRLAAWLHQLSERLTGARNHVLAVQCRPGSVAHHISQTSTELLERALAQLDQAGEILAHLQKALDAPAPSDNRESRCYRVCFMNRFARGRNMITACQRAIVISSAVSREAAIEVAKQRFAELEGIPNWQIRASFIEAGRSKTPPLGAKRTSNAAAIARPTGTHPSECGSGARCRWTTNHPAPEQASTRSAEEGGCLSMDQI
jgi:hypothetical protein